MDALEIIKHNNEIHEMWISAFLSSKKEFEEALLGSLNDIFCAISDLKGEKMSPEDKGQGVTEKDKEADRLASLQAAIEQQGKLILGLINDVDAIKKEKLPFIQSQLDGVIDRLNAKPETGA